MSIPRRFDGYIRVSRVAGRTGEGFISPQVQREQIEGWARLRGVEIVEWHEDLDQSGGKLKRPGLDKMLDRLEAGQTDGVAVAKLDRLSRLGVADALKLVERITTAGGTIAAVDLGLDPTTPFGEFGMTIMLAMARMERRRLADSWQQAQVRAIGRGVKVSPTPFGYDRSEDDGLLTPNDDARHVKRAYELTAAGDVQAATRYLQAEVPGRFWTTATVRRLLARRTYVGEAIYGEWINRKAQEPLVTRRVWEAAQTTARGRAPSSDYPLSGVATCGTCHAGMAGGSKTSSGRRAYRCTAAQTLYRGEKCPAPAAITADILEDHARALLEPIVGDLTAARLEGGPQLDAAEKVLLDTERELDEFAADLTARRLLGDGYHEHLQTRATAVLDARAAYRDLAADAEQQEKLTGTDVLADPKLIAAALRNMRLTLRVTRGRAPVGERVRLLPADPDLTAK